MDTGVVEKDSKSDYRPGFMQHFDKKDEKKKVGRKQGPQGPHDISYYFPDIPDGMDFRDFVSGTSHLLMLQWRLEQLQWLTFWGLGGVQYAEKFNITIMGIASNWMMWRFNPVMSSLWN